MNARYVFVAVSVLILLAGCDRSPVRPDVVDTLPSWATQPATPKAGFLDGVGTGASLHEAFALALKTIADVNKTSLTISDNETQSTISHNLAPCEVQSEEKIVLDPQSYDLTLRVTCVLEYIQTADTSTVEELIIEMTITEDLTSGFAVQTKRSGKLTLNSFIDFLEATGTEFKWAVYPSSANEQHVVWIRYPVQE
jgi:hypothetical protein